MATPTRQVADVLAVLAGGATVAVASARGLGLHGIPSPWDLGLAAGTLVAALGAGRVARRRPDERQVIVHRARRIAAWAGGLAAALVLLVIAVATLFPYEVRNVFATTYVLPAASAHRAVRLSRTRGLIVDRRLQPFGRRHAGRAGSPSAVNPGSRR